MLAAQPSHLIIYCLQICKRHEALLHAEKVAAVSVPCCLAPRKGRSYKVMDDLPQQAGRAVRCDPVWSRSVVTSVCSLEISEKFRDSFKLHNETVRYMRGRTYVAQVTCSGSLLRGSSLSARLT